MADQRSKRAPGGRRTPPRVAAAARRIDQLRPVAERIDPRSNPKLTGRAFVLVLVVAVLVVSFASSLKAYLQQRGNTDQMQSQIAQRQKQIAALETEKQRWQDPAFIEQQARLRFGYVRPGEKAYVALDGNGRLLDSTSSLGNPATVGTAAKHPWWSDLWSSVELAGDPPADTGGTPAAKISPLKTGKK